MITSRTILKRDLSRAAEINDAIAMEFGGGESDAGAFKVAGELGVDLPGLATMGSEHAIRTVDDNPVPLKVARHEIAQAFVLGVLTALRTVDIMEPRRA